MKTAMLGPRLERLGPLVVGALILCGCESGGGGGANTIVVGAGTSFSVASSRVSLRFDGDNLTTVRVTSPVNGLTYTSAPYGGSLYILSVPISEGPNALQARGSFSNGSENSIELTVTRVGQEFSPVGLDVAPAKGESLPHAAELRITTSFDSAQVTRLLFDIDGDGQLDSESPFSATLAVAFETAGPLKPSVTAELNDGRLLTSNPSETPTVSVPGPSVPDANLAITDVGGETTQLAYCAAFEEIFVLRESNAVVRRYSRSGVFMQQVPLAPITMPGGMHVDESGDLFVTDLGSQRVLKLVRATGYGPDPLMPDNGFFGSAGSNLGEFSNPTDVATVGRNLDQRIFVVDRDNARIQRFNRAGVPELSFNGAGSANGALSLPERIVTSGSGVRVMDRSSSRVCFFSQAGDCLDEFGSVGSGPGQLMNPVDLSAAFDGTLVVTDPMNGRVQVLSNTGQVLQSVTIATGIPQAALIIDSVTGPRLVVALEGSSGLEVRPIVLDPVGNRPESVVVRFLAAVAAGDWAAARAEVDGKGKALVDLVAANAAAANEAQTRLAGFESPIRVRESAVHALVRVETSSGEAPVDFVLTRDVSLGTWLLSTF